MENKTLEFINSLKSINDIEKLNEISNTIYTTINSMEASEEEYSDEEYNYCYDSFEAVKKRIDEVKSKTL